ncbi:MAG: beta-N-acetylhexosaminidase [Bacteroidales bacterium]|jgi:hexosaminidase
MKRLFSTFATLFFTVLMTAQITIIPKPNKLVVRSDNFKIDKGTVVFSNTKNDKNLEYLRKFLEGASGFKFEQSAGMPSANFIILDMSPDYSIPLEGYKLKVTKEGITIQGSTQTGIFYGIQTLFQMLPPVIYSGNPKGDENWTVQGAEIEDSPRFAYRGMHLDVSRTFFDAKTVKNFINWLSYHKINTFHWHLTDDNGWRIEIKKYPKLTELGAWRGENEVLRPSFGSGNERYGGFYTQKEIKEIVAYAAERHIEIIPEIDLPGHSRAVTATYPEVGCDGNDNSVSVQGEAQNVWCVGKEDNFKMLDRIVKEVAALFPSKYFHIGGDEVNYDAWDNCPHCQALMKEKGMENHEELLNYFVRRMENIVEKHGKHMAGWDEILDGGELRPESRVYAWRSVAKGIESVKKGQPTVMLPGEYCYYDMKQSPAERGHNWAGIVTLEKAYSLDPVKTAKLDENEAKLVLGVQAALWAELFGHPARFMEYQAYPRIAALAEVGWTQPELKEFTDFSYRLSSAHLERLYQMGIAFRMDPPKAVYINGAIMVTAPYPWAVVRYTTDESEPTMYSPVYRGEIITDKAHKFRFATFFKDEVKSISIQPENADYTYLTPATTIETSMTENTRFPISNVTDYKQNTYFRTATQIETGDHFTYIFEQPVKASRITVETGIPNISFYGVTDGYAEYSYDGINYTGKTEFKLNTAVLIPEKPVKKVRIVATKPNDGHILSLQDLKIEE